MAFSHAAARVLLKRGIPTLFCHCGGGLYGHFAGEPGGQVRRRGVLGALVRSSGFRAEIVESAVGSLAEPGNHRAYG